MGSESPFIVPPPPPPSFLEQVKAKIIGLGKRLLGFAGGFVEGLLTSQVLRSVFERAAKLLRPAWLFMETKLPASARPFVAKNRRKIALALGILMVLLMGRQCVMGIQGRKESLAERLAAEKVSQREEVVPIKVFKVGRFNYEDTLNALGTVKGAMEFKLSFEVPGVVSSINYREGERYEEGALLMSLKQDDILLRLKRAQAEFNKSETEHAMAKRKHDDLKKLFEMGAIPQSTLDNAKLEVDKANYAAESSRLEVKANEAMLEKSNLYAPSKGMIGELNIEEGEAVSPNTLLGSHVMTDYVFAEFGVVERDVNKIQLGQKARVFVDAYPDKTFEGVVENVAPMVAGKSRTATVRVRLENPESLLLPGMFTRVRILLYSKKNTLAIPTDSIQGEAGQQYVFVVDPKKNMAEKRAVTIGYTRPDYSQVDSGLSEGELVATSGLEQLADQKKVKVLETQEAEL